MPARAIRRSDELRVVNRHRVLSTLRREGACSRALLARRTGLSAATVSNLTAALSDEGLVRTQSAAQTGVRTNARRGRPETRLVLDGRAAASLIVLLTSDRLQAAVLDYTGAVLLDTSEAIDTRALEEATLIDAISALLDELLTQRELPRPRHVAIGFQGMTDAAHRRLLWSPILTIRNVAIAAALERRLGVPVHVHNDCRLIAEALATIDRERLGDTFAALLCSHGTGLGLFLEGRPYDGLRSSALELGHLCVDPAGPRCRCGRRGCIEAYAADYGVLRFARADRDAIPPGRIEPAELTALAARADAGEATARDAFDAAGRALGHGLVILFQLLGPMPITIVGPSPDRYRLMRPAIRHALDTLGDVQAPFDTLVRCEADEFALLQRGLAIDSLARIDRSFADRATDKPTVAQPVPTAEPTA